jgi:hypothetical protein
MGTPAASWWSADGSVLGLYVHFGPLPRDYELQLDSPPLSRLDYEAKDKEDEARAADRAKRIRETNPKPNRFHYSPRV